MRKKLVRAEVEATYRIVCPEHGIVLVGIKDAQDAAMAAHKHNFKEHGAPDVMTNPDGSAGDDGLSY
jgi:hypothetical protein